MEGFISALATIRIDDEFQELTQHGPLSFPVAFYETQPALYTGGSVALHWHEEFQFCLVTRGCIRFQCDDSAYTLHQNEGIFINSNRLHAATAAEHSDSSYYCCAVHPKILRTFEGSAIDSLFVQPFIDSLQLSAITFNENTALGKRLLEMFSRLCSLQSEQPLGYQMLVASELLSAWREIVVAYHDSLNGSYSNEAIDYQRVKELMSFIHEHYMDDISLSDLAQSIHMSKGECCRVFKRITSSTPFEYLMLYRIKQSAALLERTSLSVGEIAMQVGFNSFSYFISSFKKVVGTTPREYRKAKQTQNWNQSEL